MLKGTPDSADQRVSWWKEGREIWGDVGEILGRYGEMYPGGRREGREGASEWGVTEYSLTHFLTHLLSLTRW